MTGDASEQVAFPLVFFAGARVRAVDTPVAERDTPFDLNGAAVMTAAMVGTSGLLEGLLEAAVAAGEAIMEVYATDFTSKAKADASPVTEADERAEAIILEALARLCPEVPVVAEESVAAGRCPEVADRFFLVDPLDGTREFISRNGEFTVNIALVEAGAPVVGVVYAPALGRIFAGDRGGAFQGRVENGRPGPLTPISVRPPPSAGLVVVGSRSHGSPETDAFVRRFDVAEYRSAGSSLKFCLLACGEADLYPRFGRTMEWDTAAGDGVLRAAGGITLRPDGSPFVYGKRGPAMDADFENPHFVAVTTPTLLRRDAPQS